MPARPASSRRLLALAAASCLLVTFGAPGALAEDFEITAGTIVVRDRMGEGDAVHFYFDEGEAGGAVQQIAEAAREAGIPNRGIDEDETDKEGVRVFHLHTTIGERTSFLGRRIEGGTLAALDIFGARRILLEVYPAATVVEGQARAGPSRLGYRTFLVDGSSSIAYRVPASHLLWALLIFLGLTVVPFAGLRSWSTRLEKGKQDKVDKLHRLQVVLTIAVLAVAFAAAAALALGGLIALPDLLLGGLAPAATRIDGLRVLIGVVTIIPFLFLGVASAYWGVLPTYRKLRKTEPERPARRARMALAFALPMFAYFALRGVIQGSFGDAPAIRASATLLLFIVFLSFTPVLMLLVLPTKPISGELSGRLIELSRKAGVRVRAIRVLESRRQKVANALSMGVLPWFKYILVTDYLLDKFEQDEIEAVVAHELGHAKEHHVLIKVVSALVGLGVFVVLVSLVLMLFGRDLGDVDPRFLFLGIFLLPLALISVHGVLGLWLERRADDFGAKYAGAESMARALDRLAEVNMAKRRTGFLWNLVTQHPGIEERVERIRGHKETTRKNG